MTATNNRTLCREIQKVISSYLQGLVYAEEEIFNIEERYDEIVDEMVSVKQAVISLLQTPTDQRRVAWSILRGALDDQMTNLNEEVEALGIREGYLHFQIGAYNRLIEIMREKLVKLGC